MLLQADALAPFPLADASVHMCVTSPPYWGLRDYGTATWTGGDAACDHMAPPTGGPNPVRYTPGGEEMFRRANDKPYRDTCGKCGAVRMDRQLGLEATPDEYVAHMVTVFREVWRVLRDDGTCWLNLGDSYFSTGQSGGTGDASAYRGKAYLSDGVRHSQKYKPDVKPKDLCGIPWRVAFALQADGWWLRSDIIWAKPNPMPESVTDRPTKAHEYMFLLAKASTYYYDAEAIKEGAEYGYSPKPGMYDRIGDAVSSPERTNGKSSGGKDGTGGTRNRRTVWTIPTQPTALAHFATFPQALVEPCILAGTSAAGVCAECGAPWERVVDKEFLQDGPERAHISGGRELGTDGWEGVPRGRNNVTTTGWRPTCGHDAATVPAVVLDPFCGSGTTGAVARLHGRRFVGLDISARYLRELALPRAEGRQTAASMATLPLFAQEPA